MEQRVKNFFIFLGLNIKRIVISDFGSYRNVTGKFFLLEEVSVRIAYRSFSGIDGFFTPTQT